MTAMDEKDVKAKLKSAKEFIQQKKYKLALHECEDALKLDPKNYTSLVFSGLCHCELNDALEARKMYETATKLEPKQILAWQGFVQFYEKFSIYDDNYRRCLDSLRELTTDPVKKLDVSSKLAKLYTKMQKIEEALNECAILIKSCENEKKIEYENLTIECVGNFKLSNNDLIEMVTNCFQNRTFDDQLEISKRNELGWKFCQFLIRHDSRSRAFEIAKILLEKDSPSVEILSVISHELVSRFVTYAFDETDDLQTLNSVLNRFESINDQENASVDVLSAYLESIKEQLNNNFSDALEILEEMEPTEIETCQEYFALLSIVHLKLNNHGEALKNAEKCLSEKYPEFKPRMTFVKAESLFWLNENDPKKIPEILSLYEYSLKKCSDSKSPLLVSCSLGVARCKFLINGETAPLTEIEKNLSSSNIDVNFTLAWFHWKSKDFVSAVRLARLTVDEEPENNFSRLLLGKILWTSGEKTDETMKHFIESAKLNSNSWESFYYLALCQMEIKKNDERALSCLERANLLTGCRLEIVGVTLADLYRKLKMDEKYLKLLSSAVESVGPDVGYWAWFRYGVELVEKNRSDEAVTTFQTLLRSHPNSVRCWECLADAYCARGSYSSALKTFEKVLELEPKSLYVSYQIACIKSTLNYDDEAATKFEEILQNFDPTYVPAMLGLAESLFRGSKLLFSQGRYGRALDLRRRCIVVLTDCWKFNETLSEPRNSILCSPWKLFGDVLTSVNDFADSSLTNFYEILNEIFPSNVATMDTVNKASSTKLYLLRCGSECYMKCLRLLPNVADLWHDLAYNFLLQTKLDSGNFSKAFDCAKQAVRLNSTSSKYWSTLGCVAASAMSTASPAFVQHCFVKSLNLDVQNASAWTNLGVFYFTHGKTTDETEADMALAHECFKRAQSVEPHFVGGWIGQALIAEKFAPQEAMDLFRHCCELGNDPEGLAGYAYHVLSMILDPQLDRKSADFTYAIDHLFAMPVARDGLVKYCALRPDDVCVLNLLGCLSELESMCDSALGCYEKALTIAEASNFSSDVVDSLYSNLCRISGKLKNRTVFDKFSIRLKKLTFVDRCSTALSLYRLNMYTDAFDEFQESLKYVKSVDDEFYVKLAQCLTILNSSNVDEASKFFNKECKLIKSPVWSLALTVLSLKSLKIDDKTIRNTFEKIWSDGRFDLEMLLVNVVAISKIKLNLKLALSIVHTCPHLVPSWFILQRSISGDNVTSRKNFQKRSFENKLNNKTVNKTLHLKKISNKIS